MAVSKNKQRIQVVIDKNLFDKLQDISQKNNKSVSAVAGDFLRKGYNVFESERVRRQIFNATSNETG